MLRPTQQLVTLTRRALMCFLVLSFSAPVFGQSPRVVSVEEHWELSLAQPDPDRSAPQITMVFSPDGDVNGEHFLFTLNHGTVPEYEPGGMQVQLWDGDQLIESATAEYGALASDEEVVR